MRSTLLLLFLAGSLPACATIREVAAPVIGEVQPATRAEREAEELRREAERLRAELPMHPADVPPAERAALKTWEGAVKDKALRIVVSREARALWYMRDTTVLFSAPVAVGKQEPFTYAGKRYDFTTPVGKRRVISKDSIPIWVPPDWHYFEIAVEQELTPVQLSAKQRRHVLTDSTVIELRGKQVGRINQFGNFWPFTPGNEIIFDGKLFIPPVDSEQRRVPAVLGTRKLALGDGYLIHGTNVESSIGAAVSHGCVRMYNEDVEHLYDTVPVGTTVYIY